MNDPANYFMLLFGIFLVIAVVLQFAFDKVYTRSQTIDWHEKQFVSKKEAPIQFWLILSLQLIVGLVLIIFPAMEIFSF